VFIDADVLEHVEYVSDELDYRRNKVRAQVQLPVAPVLPCVLCPRALCPRALCCDFSMIMALNFSFSHKTLKQIARQEQALDVLELSVPLEPVSIDNLQLGDARAVCHLLMEHLVIEMVRARIDCTMIHFWNNSLYSSMINYLVFVCVCLFVCLCCCRLLGKKTCWRFND
jgi:hypothetical protein